MVTRTRVYEMSHTYHDIYRRLSEMSRYVSWKTIMYRYTPSRQPYACNGEFKITSSCPPTLIDIIVVAILGTSFIVDHFVVALPPLNYHLRVVILKINFHKENSYYWNDHLGNVAKQKNHLVLLKNCFLFPRLENICFKKKRT